MNIDQEFPIYKYWADYPNRDKEYVRWYPPTLRPVDPRRVLDFISDGPDEIAFYVHVPFCKDICPYCPFNKFSMRSDRAEAYMSGVLREIEMVADRMRTRGARITAGYFGGGTPTALATQDLIRLVDSCFDRFDIVDGAEISIEANPDTVDLEKLRALRASGVNRISFGVQSFHENLLDVLGRTHGADGALQAIEDARAADFDNIAIDLIYRVPGQTAELWQRDLRTTIDLGLDHVSTYCLFLDPGTRLYNDTLAGRVSDYPDEQAEIAMYETTMEFLGEAGYTHYTINDFALEGKQSEHHLANWQAPQKSYVGIGPGAFGYIEGAKHGLIYCVIHSLREYAKSLDNGRLPVRLGNEIDEVEKRARYMVLGLRCLEVRKAPFRWLHGVDMDDVFGEVIAQLAELDLVTSDDERVRLTAKGMHYASNVFKSFYTSRNRRMPQPIGVELFAERGASMISVDMDAGTGV